MPWSAEMKMRFMIAGFYPTRDPANDEPPVIYNASYCMRRQKSAPALN